MDVLRILEIVVAAGAVAASGFFAWRAVSALYVGAREDAHGAASARRRLRAQRMRIFTLAGLSAVGVGALAVFQQVFAGGGVLKVSGGMLVFGVFAWVSARSARRASRQGNKRAHVRERMRAHMRWKQRHQRGNKKGRGRQRRTKAPRAQRRQEKKREALRTLGLPEGASPEEVKRAWREQALRHHPDRHVSADEAQRKQHAEAFRRAQRAYDTLSRQPKR